jgi:hydrogenase expression/formation protein HypC
MNMCLAVPARIVELEDDKATVDAFGNRWDIRTTFTPEVTLGDIVLIHAGFAIARIDEEEAKETWQLLAELGELKEEFEKKSEDA